MAIQEHVAPDPNNSRRPVSLRVSSGLTAYPDALAEMERRVSAIHAGTADDLLWFLEHPPLYTAGTRAEAHDLLTPDRFPVYEVGRGGQYTYHGPGQRVAYVMISLPHGKAQVRAYVHDLESWLIATLAEFGVVGERREDRVGIWVVRPDGLGEDKIAAVGVRLRRWVTYHGVALNVAPDLEHFSGIVPCGISQHGVTSLKALGISAPMAEVDAALARTFAATFGVTLSRE